MTPRIETLNPRLLVGMHLKMSRANDKTPELWRAFMPRRGEVSNRTTAEYLSLQEYRGQGAAAFHPDAEFDKWALVEVSNHDIIPQDMSAYTLSGGQYAVFNHHGPAAAFAATTQAIFGEWLPDSNYLLDNRAHFEVLQEGYNPTDPNAQEEVWIPIKAKS